jgi:hypothetical protein
MEFVRPPYSALLPYYTMNNVLPDERALVHDDRLQTLDANIDYLENAIVATMSEIPNLDDRLRQCKEKKAELEVRRKAWRTVGKGVCT